jgi:3-phosphoshikimate 1-carboxyvinyltransferase
MPSAPTATVLPARRVRGRVRVPGDKSISHRYALIAATADGPSHVSNYSEGADCQSTLACLRGLGVEVRIDDSPGAVTIVGRGLDAWRAPSAPLDCGNSGTTMRMIVGLLAGRPFRSVLIGDESLSRRPMGRVIEPLATMGARIASHDGHAPLVIDGLSLRAIAHRPKTPSAQVKSAVLLAGLQAEGLTSVTEAAQTRDHTERALAAFGYAVAVEGSTVSIAGGQRAAGQRLDVPGDFSSAAFWMVAAAALPGSRVEIEDVGLNPTRTALVEVLRRFGARVELHEMSTAAGEPRGTVVVEGAVAGDVHIGAEEVPALIDELPAVAALAAHAGRVNVRGAAELRVKESDRIAVLVAGFRALGITAEERPDGFAIQGSGAPAGGRVDAHGDHRMAMAFAIAALAASGPSRIDGADAVAISYPGFFQTLERLVAP